MIYVCDSCKNAPKLGKFRRRYRWKTEKGFREHRCFADIKKEREERDMKQKERDKERKEQNAILLKVRIKNHRHKVGDLVYYVNYRITKPTHEFRNNRLVRVRYEEERMYYYSFGTITNIVLSGVIIEGNNVSDDCIFDTEDKAKEMVSHSQNQYNNACKEAESYR